MDWVANCVVTTLARALPRVKREHAVQVGTIARKLVAYETKSACYVWILASPRGVEPLLLG